MISSSYDIIASEYYEQGHKTCRNFDRATYEAFQARPFRYSDGMVLEVGAGRGRSIEFLNIDPSRIVQLDSSQAMFDLRCREPCNLRILADARDMPFISQQFKYVVGFLVDPFMGANFLREAFRMLEDGGTLLFTIPTRVWGDALRSNLEVESGTTRFKLIATAQSVYLPSLLSSEQEIESMLEIAGFKDISINAYPLADGEEIISDDIFAAANGLGVDVEDLSIINVVTANR